MTDVYGTQEEKISEVSKDDLTEIKGIGTTTAEKLYNAKITSVRQIAEMTPERLSETPGIGLATATKFISAAKTHLETFLKDDLEVELIEVREDTETKSSPPSIERYEVEDVEIEEVDEVEEPTNAFLLDEELEASKPQTQEQWFSNKYNYSRLTASYPPISEQPTVGIEEIEVEQPKFETEKIIDSDLKARETDIEPKIEEAIETEGEKELVEESFFERPTKREGNEITSVKPSVSKVEASRENISNNIAPKQIRDAFKNAGCYEMPSALNSLKQFTEPLDYLGFKIVSVSNDLKLLLMFPVNFYLQDGTVLVSENKLEVKNHSKQTGLRTRGELDQSKQTLLRVRDSMYEDFKSKQTIIRFLQKYLQINLSLEKGYGKNSLILLSGSTQYKVLVEPILICSSPPRSMEKSLAFPYQRSTNLHAITHVDLAPLVKFLEKKYRAIETRTKRKSSIREFKLTEDSFTTRVKYVSIPIFGYSITLLIIYYSGLHFLLRLLNTIGFAVVGIYLALLAIFYFRAYKTKKQFTDQYQTPHYLQNLEFSEIDLLDLKEELTDKLMTQFGFECLQRNAQFEALEQSETTALRHSVKVPQAESEVVAVVQPERTKPKVSDKPTLKYGTKYSSFLE